MIHLHREPSYGAHRGKRLLSDDVMPMRRRPSKQQDIRRPPHDMPDVIHAQSPSRA